MTLRSNYFTLLAFFLACVAAPSTYAATLRANATLVFESHTSFVDDGSAIVSPPAGGTIGPGPGTVTRVTDRYTLVLEDLVIPPDTYDRYEVAITAGSGKRLVVSDPSGVGISTNAVAAWGSGFGISAFDLDIAYVDGTGSLPPAGTTSGLDFASIGEGFGLNYFEFSAPGDFGFQTMIHGRDVIPAEARSGTLAASVGSLELSYSIPGVVADPGRFSFIIPEPSSLALLCLGGVALSRRRRCKN